MSVRVLNRVFESSEATGNDRVVLLVLADHAHDDGTSAYPSHATIARKAGGISERTVRDCLGRLQRLGEIAREGWSPKHTISYAITVETRQELPGSDTRKNDVADPADSSADPADSRPRSIQGNHQEPTEEPSAARPEVERLCDLQLELAKQRTDGSKKLKVTEAWRTEMRRLIDLDGRSPEQIEYVIRWVHGHHFWGGVVLAVPKLREQFDALVAKIKSEREGTSRRNGTGEHPASRRIRERMESRPV